MFSCVTLPSMATCPCASAIRASNIIDAGGDPGWPELDGPDGVGAGAGCGVVVDPPLQPTAAPTMANPNQRIVLMLPPPFWFDFRFLDRGHPKRRSTVGLASRAGS